MCAKHTLDLDGRATVARRSIVFRERALALMTCMRARARERSMMCGLMPAGEINARTAVSYLSLL